MNPTRQPDCEPLISDKQAADILGLCQKTVQRMAGRNEIPAIKLGKLWRFRASSLDAWIKNQLLSPASGGTRQ